MSYSIFDTDARIVAFNQVRFFGEPTIVTATTIVMACPNINHCSFIRTKKAFENYQTSSVWDQVGRFGSTNKGQIGNRTLRSSDHAQLHPPLPVCSFGFASPDQTVHGEYMLSCIV